MKRQACSIEAMVRQAFDLLLEIRRQRKARLLLDQAIAFLQMLVREPEGDTNPVVISIRAVRIRKN